MLTSEISSQMFADFDWFHPSASRHVAECLLMQNGVDGSYLLRPCSQLNSVALSVRAHVSVKHYTINILKDGSCRFGQVVFTSADDFLDHFRSQPLLAGESGLLTILRHPYPRDVDEPSHYEVIRIQAQMGYNQPPVTTISDHHTLTMSSKEGFLTKRGGRIKNWKVRWCVLQKMEFKYYDNRVDLTPIRVLDLRQCTACDSVNTTDGRENCFRLVFPWRTFYCSASTSGEAKEWIDLIQWTLVDECYKQNSASVSSGCAEILLFQQ